MMRCCRPLVLGGFGKGSLTSVLQQRFVKLGLPGGDDSVLARRGWTWIAGAWWHPSMTRVRIAEASERWAQEFTEIASRLRGAFGERARRIDHIGSTSVPGLAAKDVIDVQVTVDDLDNIDDAVTATGLRLRPEIVGDHLPPGAAGGSDRWRKRYADGHLGERRLHVHIRLAGRPNQRYALLFRDYLRAHPDAAMAYERAKRALAKLAPDTATYADAKDPVCDLVIAAAEPWASRSGWEPGPSDA